VTGQESGFKDHFSGHSAEYARYRPLYPDEFFAAIRRAVPKGAVALDCATGSGQLALGLVAFCERIIATDASPEQIASARPHPRIEYRVAAAESTGLDNASVDLLTVGQALHWFDHDRFGAEARRVVVPGGLLVCASYANCSIADDIDAIVNTLYVDILDDYWPAERALVETGYRSIALPGEPVPFPALESVSRWTAESMLGYLRTWSAVKRYERERGDDPVTQIEASLLDAWGPGVLAVTWPLNVKATRL
jgi:SAM-dependent methyltransferase